MRHQKLKLPSGATEDDWALEVAQRAADKLCNEMGIIGIGGARAYDAMRDYFITRAFLIVESGGIRHQVHSDRLSFSSRDNDAEELARVARMAVSRNAVSEESQRKALADETHAGFSVSCNDCGSETVIVESSIGYSQESGRWGSVDLVCCGCQKRTSLYGD